MFNCVQWAGAPVIGRVWLRVRGFATANTDGRPRFHVEQSHVLAAVAAQVYTGWTYWESCFLLVISWSESCLLLQIEQDST